jgi:hypothetical protein
MAALIGSGSLARNIEIEDKQYGKLHPVAEDESELPARWRVVFICSNVLVSVVLMVLNLQFSWEHAHFAQPLNPALDGIKLSITALTLLMLLQLAELAWFRHINSDEYRLAKEQDEEPSQFGFFLCLSFWLELLVCAVHCPSDMLVKTGLDDSWNLCILARLYWLLRAAYWFSAVYRMRRAVQYRVRQSDAYLKMREEGGVAQAPIPYSTSTIVKVFFSEHAWQLLFWSTVVVFLAMSYAVYVCERSEQPDLFTFGNSLYFTATMITTIGSSIQPNHPFGRTLSLVASLFGVAFLSLSVVVLLDTLRLQGPVELESMVSVELIKADIRRKRHHRQRTERLMK